MMSTDKGEARDMLSLAHEYAKNGVRFVPMLVADDEEAEKIICQNMERSLNAMKGES